MQSPAAPIPLAACLSVGARTILAICAHAGDMELACGAALARAVGPGDQVVLLYLTPGEHGKPGVAEEECGGQARQETQAAAAPGAEVFSGA